MSTDTALTGNRPGFRVNIHVSATPIMSYICYDLVGLCSVTVSCFQMVNNFHLENNDFLK